MAAPAGTCGVPDPVQVLSMCHPGDAARALLVEPSSPDQVSHTERLCDLPEATQRRGSTWGGVLAWPFILSGDFPPSQHLSC